MKQWLLTFATGLAMDLLRDLSLAVWDAFWATVADAVTEAERKWQSGPIKKEWVIEKALTWLKGRERLSWLRKWGVKLFLGRIIDELIEELNTELGHNWAAKVDNLKARLERKIRWFRR